MVLHKPNAMRQGGWWAHPLSVLGISSGSLLSFVSIAS